MEETDQPKVPKYKTNLPYKLNPEDEREKPTDPSWTAAEKHTKDAEKWGKVLEGLAADFVTASQELNKALLGAYRNAPLVDCNFGDSPIAPRKQIFATKAYLKKLGWAGISVREVMTPSVNIHDLSKFVSDGCKWILKAKNEKAD